MTIWIGQIGITVYSEKKSYIENLSKRFSGFISDNQGQIDLEIVETNFKPEITKRGEQYFWFTMFSENIYVYIDTVNWKGKAFICEEIPVRYDAIDTMLTMIAAQFLPMFASVLVHGCCIDYDGMGLCFMGDSGSGKSTLVKILSADYRIIAEDMFCLECYENKIIARSIPVGQKHLWVESDKNVAIKNICFLQNGITDIKVENNRTKIFNNLLHNQFYKARKNDIMLMDAMRFNISRISRHVSFFDFFWDADRFYQKDRCYIKDIKDSITNLMKQTFDELPIDTFGEDTFLLSKHIYMREDVAKNKLELWDASIHRLYGVTGLSKNIINYAIENSQFTFRELEEYIKSQIMVEPNILRNVLYELLDKNIIKGGHSCNG